MKHEKSCGALVYRIHNNTFELLLIKHRLGGHWSFPKGHVEQGETERQTALREVKEETGLDIELKSGFRESVQYCPHPNLSKKVVYFIGEALPGEVHKQEKEIMDIQWVPFSSAEEIVTHENDKRLIQKAKEYLF
ncbi:bis(5'-nucleosyl)-tetraphosphatase [Acetanaerobacterium elongatum]|uniref:Bis(5'-nucleosyl)-tetraphosphatase [asymmetrical] n=1 Tax=Acetanaerobacterium elongatum TaxID=258515 RepID=A0A1G9XQW8_9FIRM|nr:NUDIX domain-containing protein [Acetanaerobacterium elongatum]SDM98796.1 ADP-ribose pyrophosphatase YjhB, NUDIX family [Acetanaerobacterium elongatum]